MGVNDLALELSLNTQTENCDSTRFCVPNPTADKIRNWDLPSLINLSARSLNSEKVDEHVTVCVSETWFKDYMDSSSLTMQGFCLERKERAMDEPVV